MLTVESDGHLLERCICCLGLYAPPASAGHGVRGLCRQCRERSPRPEKVHCRDCGALLRLAPRGRPRLRCDYCDRVARSERTRIRRAGSRPADG